MITNQEFAKHRGWTVIREMPVGFRLQGIERRDDEYPDETEEEEEQKRGHKVQVTFGQVLYALIRLVTVSVLAVIILVFLTSALVVGSQVGVVGFVEFIAGVLTGQYGYLSSAQVLALRGSLESALFLEFLGLLVVGLFVFATGFTYSDPSARARLRRKYMSAPDRKEPRRETRGERDRRLNGGRSSIGVGMVMITMAIFIVLALLLQVV